jgi:outer membrane murein-binding lipoprotein Lpp
MKKAVMVSAILLLCSMSRAQETAPAPSSSGNGSAPLPQDARINALEEQVRTLAEQVALLQGEMKALRDAKSPSGAPEGQILLASAHVQPGTESSSSVPAEPLASQVPQTQAGGGAQPQTLGGATSNAKLLNPDISLIGDFIGTAGHNAVSPSPSLQLHETEVGMQAIIDPYARADAFISFGETGVNIEEGYVTFTSLPAGLLLKVGKMRADFGKVNTIHNHALPYIDRPLVTNLLVGGEDGIDDAGLSLSHFIPAPKGWFMEGTAQVYRGDSDSVFSAYRRQDLSVVGHVRAYRDLSESTNLDLGVSYARGNSAGLGIVPNPSAFFTNLYATDATLRWKPLRRAVYKNLLFRTELFWSARDQLSALNIFETQHAFGMYSSAEYRLNRRWTVGGRFDRSGHATNANLTDTGFSGILTYWPSEFSQIRGQYRYGHLAVANPGDFSNANEFLFQFLFVMGAHGAHPF